MKKAVARFIILSLLLLAGVVRAQPPYYNAENLRSDTFDILRYTIDLEIGSTTAPFVQGSTTVKCVALKNNISRIRLDLLKMQVDSVSWNGVPYVYTYNDTILRVNFSAAKNTGDTSYITVYYHGQPQIDATGWGGFYFNNTQGAQYAFNLGVGFGAKPHNYGRVWFPCFDNFVERSTFDFRITTDSARKAYCNGVLVSDQVSGAKRTRHWFLQHSIPSYLASVTVARYTQVTWTTPTIQGPKPVVLAAHASDTTNMKVAFANLSSCIAGFEHYFGPYRWDRVGYCLVPFSGGAMEHAGNITYPRNSIGSLAYEELITHELSHHWWGNLITCETPEDMWINEGMASFSANMFFEWQYGKSAYKNRVLAQHEELLHFLHLREGGFKPVSGLPHELTYSDHVYKKGAIMAHNLRAYLGDSLFFRACRDLMQQKAFAHVNSNEMRDIMQNSSGKNLQYFFDNWIFNPGWSHFSIDSVTYQPVGSVSNATVHIRQKLYGALFMHSNVPLEITFFKSDMSSVTYTTLVSGALTSAALALPFLPVLCSINYNSALCDASAPEIKMIKGTGTYQYNIAKATLQVTTAGSDSSMVRIIHHYVAPDPFRNTVAGHILSNQHYWSVETLADPQLRGKLRFYYDGNKNFTTYGYMDTMLTRVNGDSMALFYRPDAGSDWTWLRHCQKVKFGSRQGYLETDSIMGGEFAFGNLGDTTDLSVGTNSAADQVNIFPNPSTHQVTVAVQQSSTLLLLDAQGRKLLEKPLRAGENIVDLSSFTKGTYVAEIVTGKKTMRREKLLLH